MTRGLRVVSGSAGGLRLVAPKGARPSTDRVKEALFASLGPGPIEGAAVLDLYAGSGALGIEALSRGAARAVFVDRDRRAVDAIHVNLETTGFAEQARVHGSSVGAFVRRRPSEPFGLVLLDPPYDLSPAELGTVLAALSAPGRLEAGATVVLECRAGSRPALPEGWRVGREREYGDTLVVVATV
jgi:16S rRNA (guanine966-N2)-methyltransferase